MPQANLSLGELAQGLRQAKSAAAGLAGQLKRLGEETRAAPARVLSACAGGSCTAGGASNDRRGVGTAGSQLSQNLGRTLSRSLGDSLTQSLRQSLTGVVQSLSRSLTGLASRAVGGGLFGSLFGGLIGGGISALFGKLTGPRQRVNVDGVVRTEVLNFPRLSSLDFATNPASRLYGGRAVPRGAGFQVTVDYRHGAEDIITAKVARQLADLNSLTGVV